MCHFDTMPVFFFLLRSHFIVYERMQMYVYSHHSSNGHVEVVQWLIKNTKFDDDTAGDVLRWACG
jgi:hypothetical protein